MQPVPSWWDAALRESHQVVVEASWNRGGVSTPLGVVSGAVTADRRNVSRWACDVTVTPDAVADVRGGLDPYGARLVLKRGIRTPGGDSHLCGLGVYRVQSVDLSSPLGGVTISGVSLESAVTDARFPTPRTPGASSALPLLKSLIVEAVPDATFTVDAGIANRALPKGVTWDTDRWDSAEESAVEQLRRVLAADVGTDGFGVFRVQPTPTAETPVWEVDAGGSGVLVAAASSLSRDGVTNLWVVTGEPSDSNPVGPAFAWDTLPGSPTYAGVNPTKQDSAPGPFGVVTGFYSSPLLGTLADCQATALSLLADSLGLAKSVSFTSLSNPALEVGDCVGVATPLGRELHVIDSIGIGLGASEGMACSTRATTVRVL